MKKFKKVLAAAIAMMSLSTAAAVTGTVAWFTANNIVSAQGMNIQAEAEEGIVISNEAKSTWATSATASHSSAISVLPTSTADAVTWYRNNSDNEEIYGGTDHIGTYLAYTADNADNAKKFSVSNGAGSIDIDQDATTTGDTKNIFLLNSFYIKSTTNPATPVTKPLYINKVDISGNSVALHNAVRVLVKCNNAVKVYRLADGDTEYTVGGTATTVSAIVEGDPVNTELLNSVTIPNNNTTEPLEIQVYCYFEGEDTDCTSKNAAATDALNALSVSLQFGTKTK